MDYWRTTSAERSGAAEPTRGGRLDGVVPVWCCASRPRAGDAEQRFQVPDRDEIERSFAPRRIWRLSAKASTRPYINITQALADEFDAYAVLARTTLGTAQMSAVRYHRAPLVGEPSGIGTNSLMFLVVRGTHP